MNYVTLGRTGLQVSRVCLGCMSYGQAKTPGVLQWHWTLSEEDSRPHIQRALELGVNFFDTANVYSNGESEAVLGRAIRDFTRRDEVVLATKVWGPMRQGPNGRGLSRKAILSEVDNSLRRLGTDYIDLYIIHRYDYDTPLEETLEALNDVVRAGKVRYLGASSMHAWQFMKAIGLQRAHGWAPFISMQNYYNLLYREDEREMLRLCASEGIGVTPWSPLARGKLARPLPSERDDRAREDRCVRQDAVREDDGHRQARDRPDERDREGARRAAGAGGDGVAAAQAGGHVADLRRHRAAAARGRDGGDVADALGRGNGEARGAVSAASGDRRIFVASSPSLSPGPYLLTVRPDDAIVVWTRGWVRKVFRDGRRAGAKGAGGASGCRCRARPRLICSRRRRTNGATKC